MKRIRLTAGCLGIALSFLAGCRRPDTTLKDSEILSVEWEKLPDLPGPPDAQPLGVSAPFYGLYHDRLLVAGGCNFPDTPAAEGGNKRYYDEIRMLDLSHKTNHDIFARIDPPAWKLVGKLPAPVAYGASVSTPQGIICIGGNNCDSSFVQVIRLAWNENESRVTTTPLPELPFPLDNLAATYAGNKVYVAGGNQKGHPSSAFLCLDLTQPGKGWTQLPSFPGPARVQPVLAARQAPEGVHIYLAGGFQPPLNGKGAVLPTDLLAYSPEQKQWKTAARLPSDENGRPHTFTGGGCIAWGDRSLLFMGGVDYERFLAALDRPRQIESAQAAGNQPLTDSLHTEARQYMHHPVPWYRFNRELWEYNTFTGRWRSLGAYEPLARAGAGIIRHGRYLIIVNGELKAGIRTPQVNKARL